MANILFASMKIHQIFGVKSSGMEIEFENKTKKK